MTEPIRANGKILQLIDLLRTSGGLLIDAEIVETDSPASATPTLRIELSGQDAGLFVSNDGELLKAVHQVASAALNLSTEEQDSLWFDVNHLKAGRKAQLQRLAAEAVDQVRRTSQPYAFAPMISCERHMLHLALASSGLMSASQGRGVDRCVVLYPEGVTPPIEHGPTSHPSPPSQHFCDAA